MEEEIKEWLKKKLEKTSKKEDINKTSNKILQNSQVSRDRESSEVRANAPETIIKREKEIAESVIKAPIQEKSSPIFSSIKETQPNVISTKSSVPVIIRKEGISPIKEFQAVERDSETGKPRINDKILIGIALTLGIIIIIISFFVFIVPNIPSENHEYKIFITHNGKPLDVGKKESSYQSFSYTIYLYNNHSYCGDEFIDSGSVQSPDYAFHSYSMQNGRILKNYEKQNYAFSLLIKAISPNVNLNWFTEMIAKDAFDAELNYKELPKLSKSFSITFDIPLITKEKFIYWKNESENKIYVHSELYDDWEGNATFFCFFERNYDQTIDNNLRNCSTQITFEKNQQCAQRFISVCNRNIKVIYISEAQKHDRKIDCIIPLSNLTKNKTYEIRILLYKQLNQELYLEYAIKENILNI